jgi:AraC family transcriptional regulator
VYSTVPPEPSRASPYFSEMRALATSVMRLLEIAGQELDKNRAAAKAHIVRASSLLRAELDRQTPNEHPAPANSLFAWQARRVREYIDEHLAARIQISDLSGVAQRSKAHFARSFKQTFGQTPHAYLVRRRVEFASNLMRISEDSLSTIALACGFTDQAHLCRQFRRCVGQSPAAWRRERCETYAAKH